MNQKTRYIISKLEKSKLWAPVDRELYEVLNAINSIQGITSDVSCQGHGKSYPYIFFCIDGSQDSFYGLSLLTLAANSVNWLVQSSVIGGLEDGGLYFYLTPRQSIADNIDGSQKLKVRQSCFYGNERANDDLRSIADYIDRNRQRCSCTLRKPLFPIPEGL